MPSYSGRDFTAEFERLLTALRAALPQYTDLNHSDFGVVLLRLLARETDQLNAYIDQVFGEGFIDYAQFRQSLLDLGKLVGYQGILASSATTQFTLTRTPAMAGAAAIAIPQYTVFTRSDGVQYLTSDAVIIPAGQQSVMVDAIQGTLTTQDFAQANFVVQDWSGRPSANLGALVAAGSVQVWQDVGIYWTEVDSFWRSAANDLAFRLDLNGDTDEIWLTLGDGTQGQGPPNATLHTQFIRTSGATGNCGTSMVTGVPDTLRGQITCTNLIPATGGAPSQTMAGLRQQIPAVTRTQRRAVTKTDYEALVGNIPGVAFVQCLDRNDAEYWPFFYVALYVVPAGGGPMSPALQSEIWSQCADWGHLGSWQQRYLLFDATAVQVPVSVTIGVAPGLSPQAVVAAVTEAIQALVSPANMGIGQPLTFLSLFQAVSWVAGVTYTEFITPTSDVVPANGQVITLGSVTVLVG